ncbi:MAG: hypothetical protein C5B58_15190 [Acidobacteria bacterium]|nr:MAG: hypothetical protein C5B58_15190 [Acidobacteriota bacterium]
MNSSYPNAEELSLFERSVATTSRGFRRLARRLAHQLTALPFTVEQKAQYKANRPKLDEPQVRKILRALRKNPNGLSRRQISDELFGRNLSSANISEALEYLRSLGAADSVTERTAGRSRERWFAV